MQRLKDILSTVGGYLLAFAVGLLWVLNRRKPVVLAPVHVEPKVVPKSDFDVLEAAVKASLIKP